MRYKLYFKLNKPLKLKLNYHEDIQRFIYLFYVCEYTVAVQMVVSHHVVAGK